MLRATSTSFTPDLNLQLRAPTAGAATEAYTSPAIPLKKLAAHWNTNEWGVAKRLLVEVGLPAVALSGEQSYEFVLQVDALDSFGSPITVATAVLSGAAIAETGARVTLSVDMADMANFDVNAGYLRLVMTPSAGRDTALITMVDEFWSADAEFTLDDGTNGAESVKVGTAEVGTVTFDAVATAGLIITIDDGVNAPVAFEFGDAPLILVGADANASAANFAAAVQAAVTAGDLDLGVSVLNAVVTITNLAGVTTAIFTDSAITETADAGSDTTVATFAGGEAGAVQPQAIIEHNGGTYVTQRQQIVAAIEALASGSFAASLSGDVITVRNSAPDLGVSEGEALEVADAGNSFAITDFAAAAASIDFWAYVKSGANPH